MEDIISLGPVYVDGLVAHGQLVLTCRLCSVEVHVPSPEAVAQFYAEHDHGIQASKESE